MGRAPAFRWLALCLTCSVCSGRIPSENREASKSFGNGLVEPFSPMSFPTENFAQNSDNDEKASDPKAGKKWQEFCEDPAGAVPQEPVIGPWTDTKNWNPLFHPYVVLFWTHVSVHVVATILAVKAPLPLMIVVVCSGLLWPISAAFNLEIWDVHHTRFSPDWWMTFVKWLIVDLAAGLPVLYLRVFKSSYSVVTYIGIWIYVVLGANIVWTMFYQVDGWVRAINTVVGGFLTLSLILNCIALTKHKKPLLEMRKGIPYGRATPFAWLLCYTFWNAMFVADYSPGMTLQDILFWAMMYIFQFLDEEPLTIEYYFAYARPVQLATYIATGCWSGIVSYFKSKPTLAQCQPLPVNDHPYFLFLCQANLLLSLYCTMRSVRALVLGPAKMPVQRRLTQVAPDNRMSAMSTTSSRGSVELSVR